MGNKDVNVPEIRFSGFNEAWEQRKLRGIARFSKGKGYSKNDLVMDGSPILLYGSLYTKYKSLINEVSTKVIPRENSVYSTGNEVVVPASGETAEDIARASFINRKGIILGGDLNIISPMNYIDNHFLALSLSNGVMKQDLASRAQGKSVVHIHNSDIEHLTMRYPELKEQELIGNVFVELDNTITLHQRELETLQKLKTHLLSKMFTEEDSEYPEIRFKGFNSEWKKLELRDVLTEYYEKAYDNGEYEHVSLTQKGVVPKCERYDRDSLVTTENKTYRIVRYNDICYNPANLKFGVISRNKYKDSIFSPIYITYKVTDIAVPNFAEYMVTRKKFILKALKNQEGTVYERMSVKSDDLLAMTCFLPSIKEQMKIGNMLDTLDNTITLHQLQLENLEKIKKVLLDKMFV